MSRKLIFTTWWLAMTKVITSTQWSPVTRTTLQEKSQIASKGTLKLMRKSSEGGTKLRKVPGRIKTRIRLRRIKAITRTTLAIWSQNQTTTM